MSRRILLGIGIVVLVIIGAFLILKPNKNLNSSQTQSVRWEQDENGWKAIGNPPPCPQPLAFGSIVDIEQATSVLYPGQMRSVGYENTAGFRFDGLANDEITVYAPMDGEIVRAARFLVDGELQYVVDIVSPCGIMNRFDHILVLPAKLQAMADTLPAPKENDNRSTSVSPPITILKGETLATAVGLKKDNNTFIAWTVFDLRSKNKVSQNPAWASQHHVMDHYAICPYLYLSTENQKVIKTLPAADSMSGSISDFCG
jgi:hypothetical protein